MTWLNVFFRVFLTFVSGEYTTGSRQPKVSTAVSTPRDITGMIIPSLVRSFSPVLSWARGSNLKRSLAPLSSATHTTTTGTDKTVSGMAI